MPQLEAEGTQRKEGFALRGEVGAQSVSWSSRVSQGAGLESELGRWGAMELTELPRRKGFQKKPGRSWAERQRRA